MWNCWEEAFLMLDHGASFCLNEIQFIVFYMAFQAITIFPKANWLCPLILFIDLSMKVHIVTKALIFNYVLKWPQCLPWFHFSCSQTPYRVVCFHFCVVALLNFCYQLMVASYQRNELNNLTYWCAWNRNQTTKSVSHYIFSNPKWYRSPSVILF